MYTYKIPMKLPDEVDRQRDQPLDWEFIYPVSIPTFAKADGIVRMRIEPSTELNQ